ncbi:MAG: hypothetical protein JXX28_06850, partial [Deltaproteobacteria bacterium]|nr:hypothetical protein [Deltaproteobacteria bacterium]
VPSKMHVEIPEEDVDATFPVSDGTGRVGYLRWDPQGALRVGREGGGVVEVDFGLLSKATWLGSPTWRNFADGRLEESWLTFADGESYDLWYRNGLIRELDVDYIGFGESEDIHGVLEGRFYRAEVRKCGFGECDEETRTTEWYCPK